MYTVWHELFCLVQMDASSLFTVQGKCIYKIFKAEIQQTQFLLLCTNVELCVYKTTVIQ